jgi:hypothetical protein
MAEYGYRYNELPENNLLLANGIFTWYDYITDTTYRATLGQIFAGLQSPDGAWNENTEYEEGDIVSHLGKIWIATSEVNNLGQPPSDASIYWDEEPDPAPVNSAWPLDGAADLAGVGTLIRGGNTLGVQIGEADTGEEIALFAVAVGDGATGFADLICAPNAAALQTSNLAEDVFSGINTGAGITSLYAGETAVGQVNISFAAPAGSTPGVSNLLNTPDDNSIILLEQYFVAVDGGAGDVGLGIRRQYIMTNDSNESYVVGYEDWVYTDPTQNAEDVDWIISGTSGGAVAPFLSVRGGTDNQIEFYGPAKLKSYTVAGVPSAALHTQCLIWVSNQAGGAQAAYSDGTDWRTVRTGAVISV